MNEGMRFTRSRAPAKLGFPGSFSKKICMSPAIGRRGAAGTASIGAALANGRWPLGVVNMPRHAGTGLPDWVGFPRAVLAAARV